MNPFYRIFIDESGGSGININEPNDRYLTLTGVIICLEDYRNIVVPKINQFKNDIFGSQSDKPIILHRDEIIRKQGNFSILFSKEEQVRFDTCLLDLYKNLPYRVISVSIDKHNHHRKYGYIGFEPYFYCLTVLLERYVLYLENINSIGDVMIESRDKIKDRRLGSSYNLLWVNGTKYINQTTWQSRISTSSIKIIEKKMNETGLQLADLVAHPCRYDTLLEYGVINLQLAPFGRSLCAILRQGKYVVSRRGVLKGCGLKLLSIPDD